MTATTLQRELSSYISPFEQALAAGNIDLANCISMLAAERLLKRDVESARPLLWEHIFSKLALRYRSQYQCYDFELIDYGMYPVIPRLPLFRGPQPDTASLANGRYITVLGAAQLFGRFHKLGPHTAIANALDVAAVNLSMGGAGPETFARDEFFQIANAGRAVVLQVLSGRSVGCDEYPGGRRTSRLGEGPKVARLTLLREIWNDSRGEAKRLVGKWQQRYVEAMSDLVGQITVPVVLAWISVRSPDAWSIGRLEESEDFGSFPHLVDRNMVTEIANKCASYVEVANDTGLPHGFVSRFTGEPCPRMTRDGQLAWRNEYYPSSEAGLTISSQIATALRNVLTPPMRQADLVSEGVDPLGPRTGRGDRATQAERN